MAIKDLRKQTEKYTLDEARELLKNEEIEKEIELSLDDIRESLKESGYKIIKEEVETVVFADALKEEGFVVYKKGSLDESIKDTIIKDLESEGFIVMDDNLSEEVEEKFKDKIMEELEAEGYIILDEATIEAVDEQLQLQVQQMIEESMKKDDKDPMDKDPMDKDPMDQDPMDKDPMDKDSMDQDPMDQDEKCSKNKKNIKDKESTKESFLESLITGEKLEDGKEPVGESKQSRLSSLI